MNLNNPNQSQLSLEPHHHLLFLIEHNNENNNTIAPWYNLKFMAFVLLVAGYGTVFFQLFTTLPLYYRDIYLLPESQIGWLLALNGFLVFAVEMPLVAKLGTNVSLKKIVSFGAILAGLGLIILNAAQGIWILVISMTLLSFSEILAMPFMTTFTVQAATEKSRGRYLGLYSVGYSIAFIAAPSVGTFLIESYSYSLLWNVLLLTSIAVAAGLFYTMTVDKK